METLKSSDVYDDGNKDSTEFIHTQPLTGATNCLKVSWVRIPNAQTQKLRSRRVESPRQSSDPLPSPCCDFCEPQSPEEMGPRLTLPRTHQKERPG